MGSIQLTKNYNFIIIRKEKILLKISQVRTEIFVHLQTAVAQSVKPMTFPKEVMDSIPALATCSLIVGSVPV